MGLTILDVHRIIEQDVQKMGFFAYKDLEHEEIDIQINRQIDIIVNGILDKHFRRELKLNEEQGFQKNTFSVDNFRSLHKMNVFIPFALNVNDSTKTAFFILPTDYYHHIKTTMIIKYDCYEDGKKVEKKEEVAVRIAE